MNMLAEMVLAGEEFTDGMDLGIPGYNTVSVTASAARGSSSGAKPGAMWTPQTGRNIHFSGLRLTGPGLPGPVSG